MTAFLLVFFTDFANVRNIGKILEMSEISIHQSKIFGRYFVVQKIICARTKNWKAPVHLNVLDYSFKAF